MGKLGYKCGLEAVMVGASAVVLGLVIFIAVCAIFIGTDVCKLL